MKKRILAIDPSWNGFAFVYYDPFKDYWACDAYNIVTKKTKDSTSVIKTIGYVSKLLMSIIEEYPNVSQAELVVIESQFHTKMQNLQYITATYLHALLGDDITLKFVSALTVKRHFEIPYKGFTHHQNKINAINFVKNSEDKLRGTHIDHDDDDNICDALLLLNYCLDKK